jgi:hypothetical protein
MSNPSLPRRSVEVRPAAASQPGPFTLPSAVRKNPTTAEAKAAIASDEASSST